MGQGSEPRAQRGGGRREGDAGDARYGASRREDASSWFPSQTRPRGWPPLRGLPSLGGNERSCCQSPHSFDRPHGPLHVH